MKLFKLISIKFYVIVSLITIAVGFKFLFAKEYFSYHAQASGINWVEVNPGLQTVFMALFKVCGAGFITVGLCLILMIIIPFAKQNKRWSFYVIPIIGISFWIIVFLTTLYVTITTPGNAPWISSLISIILYIIGFIFSIFYLVKNKHN